MGSVGVKEWVVEAVAVDQRCETLPELVPLTELLLVRVPLWVFRRDTVAESLPVVEGLADMDRLAAEPLALAERLGDVERLSEPLPVRVSLRGFRLSCVNVIDELPETEELHERDRVGVSCEEVLVRLRVSLPDTELLSELDLDEVKDTVEVGDVDGVNDLMERVRERCVDETDKLIDALPVALLALWDIENESETLLD